jgi:3-hydroxybutyryl-CoA dehydrogenase
MQNESLLVVGAGQMGLGIVQVAAQAEMQVFLADATKELALSGKDKLSSQLQAIVNKGKITEQQRANILGRVTPVGRFEEAVNVDFAIEAATENKAIKGEIFKKLDVALNPLAILATNTSSISITEIAAQTKRPERVVGMHFMNPVPVMKLVEGIRGLQTSTETFDRVRALSDKMGKTFVSVQDVPGFAVNRILMPMINEAIQSVYEGIGSPQDIDTAMKLGTNQPMGPLELADFIGLDTCLAIMNVMHEGFGDSKYRPSPLLKKYVMAGWLGKKAGKGFYNYGEKKQ